MLAWVGCLAGLLVIPLPAHSRGVAHISGSRLKKLVDKCEGLFEEEKDKCLEENAESLYKVAWYTWLILGLVLAVILLVISRMVYVRCKEGDKDEEIKERRKKRLRRMQGCGWASRKDTDDANTPYQPKGKVENEDANTGPFHAQQPQPQLGQPGYDSYYQHQLPEYPSPPIYHPIHLDQQGAETMYRPDVGVYVPAFQADVPSSGNYDRSRMSSENFQPQPTPPNQQQQQYQQQYQPPGSVDQQIYYAQQRQNERNSILV